MCHVQRRISDGLNVLQFFTTRAWEFKSDKFAAIYKELTPKDKVL